MEGYTRHTKAVVPPEYADELAHVDQLARQLVDHIRTSRGEIARLHVHGAKSKALQDHFAVLLRHELGFGAAWTWASRR